MNNDWSKGIAGRGFLGGERGVGGPRGSYLVNRDF